MRSVPRARRTPAARPPPGRPSSGSRRDARRPRRRSRSVNVCPSAKSRALSSTKFSTIPFRTTASSSWAHPVSGCALSSDTRPCVAHRVCPTPVVESEPFRAGGRLQLVEVPDRADVVEAVSFEQRQPGRVVAAVLEALEAAEEEALRGARADVSDDPAHPNLLRRARSPSCCEKRSLLRLALETREPGPSAELPCDEGRDPTTEVLGQLVRFGLGQDANDGLGAGGADEDPSALAEPCLDRLELSAEARA